MKTFTHLPIIKDRTVLSSELLIYMYLERYGARKGTCTHSKRTIATGTKLSLNTVARRLKSLEEKDYIQITNRYRKNGGKTSNAYQILK